MRLAIASGIVRNVTRVMRIDRGALRPPEYTDTGMRAEGAFSRAGVYPYRNDDGSIRYELRPESEVFDALSLDSLRGIVVTIEHPIELLTPGTAKAHAVGAVGDNIRRDGDWILGNVTVFDGDAIAIIKAGKQELSLGYTCVMDWTPGVYKGQRYDGIQTKIIANHLCFTEVARAGSTARIKMDRMDCATMIDEPTDRKDTAAMDKDQEIATLKAQLAAATAPRTDAAAATAQLATITAERDAAVRRAAEAETARADAQSPAAMAAMRARVSLEESVRPILGADFKMDGVTDTALRAAVVKALQGSEIKIPDGRTDAAYVDAYTRVTFDGLMRDRAAGASAFDDLAEGLTDDRADSVPGAGPRTTLEKAHAQMEHDSRNAWRNDSAYRNPMYASVAQPATK